MKRSTIRIAPELLIDLLLPSLLSHSLTVKGVTYCHGSLTFELEHDRHDMPEGEVQAVFKSVGPVVGIGGRTLVNVLDKIESVAPLSVAVAAVRAIPDEPSSGRSFNQLTDLVKLAYAENAVCVFVTPVDRVTYWMESAEKAALALNLPAYIDRAQRMLKLGGAHGRVFFVGEDELRHPDKFRGLDIKKIEWDHACFTGQELRDATAKVLRVETKPATVPSTAPTPRPTSPTPKPAPNTTEAPAAPETKDGGSIGNAIATEQTNFTSYKP